MYREREKSTEVTEGQQILLPGLRNSPVKSEGTTLGLGTKPHIGETGYKNVEMDILIVISDF